MQSEDFWHSVRFLGHHVKDFGHLFRLPDLPSSQHPVLVTNDSKGLPSSKGVALDPVMKSVQCLDRRSSLLETKTPISPGFSTSVKVVFVEHSIHCISVCSRPILALVPPKNQSSDVVDQADDIDDPGLTRWSEDASLS